ncbi:MAG TPA: hypothetical protein P5526_23835 [Anaerolineae bacterium]|nr:hypothetical protein [Anaerolineae bacterium]
MQPCYSATLLPYRRYLRHDRAEIKRKFDEIVAFAEVEKFLTLPI